MTDPESHTLLGGVEVMVFSEACWETTFCLTVVLLGEVGS